LKKVEDGKKPHVLLGNGFSRACKDDIFAYSALFERADFKRISIFGKKAFGVLKTTDFEIVMDALRQATKLIRLYSPKNKKLSKRLNKDAKGLKEVLVDAIAGSHPSFPADIPTEAYRFCKKFLNRFNRIYTLNYDLLLYWTAMQDEVQPPIKCDDGFRTPDDKTAEYVTWEPENTYQQNIYYLHGGLHIFDAGHEIQKYTWVRTGVRLMDQIRSALDNELYPLFVAEGSSSQKLEKIRHSDYLSKAYRSFSAIKDPLFIYGHSLADNDKHFLRLIEKGKVSQVFVGLHGNPNKESNMKIILRARSLSTQRGKYNPLSVEFFDSKTAKAWG